MKKSVILYSVFTLLFCCVSVASFAGNAPEPITLEPSILLKHEIPYAGHGVAGDEVLLFNIEIQPPDISGSESGINVYLRQSKQKVGALEPVDYPAWTIPMSMKTESYASQGMQTSGTIFVVEVGLLSPTKPPIFHKIIKYGYSYSPEEGFSHQVLDVGYLPLLTSPPGTVPNGLALPENFDFVTTSDGKQHIVIADAMVGTVWSASVDDLSNWQMQLFAQELGATPMTRLCEYNGELIVGFCGYARGPDWTIEHYVQAMWQPIPGVDLKPGPFGLTYVGLTGKIALNNAGTGAIYQIDAETLLNPTQPPFYPFKELQTLLEPISGVSDFQGSLIWDNWHPNTEWLYWQRIISTYEEKHFPIYRVNIFTGEVQFIAESVMLFDHPSMISVLPTRGTPFTTLVTSNTQERNMALTNRLVTESNLVSPSVVVETKILIPPSER